MLTTATMKTVTLKDGTEAVIRPMQAADLDRSFRFFQAMPEEDRVFLRVDVTDRDLVAKRIRMMHDGSVQRLVALADDDVIADGALELDLPGWNQEIGELRLFVARTHQRMGLGALMARELYGLAARAKVKEIIVRMMRPQLAARSIFRRLGFREQRTLSTQTRDLRGRRHDLVLMRCDLEALWMELEDYLAHSDWQRTR